MTLVNLLALGLGTWGMAWLLVYGTGPAAMLSKLRHKLGVRYTDAGERYGETWVGELFNCPVCISVWIAPVLMIMLFLGGWYLLWVLAAIGAVEIISCLGDR